MPFEKLIFEVQSKNDLLGRSQAEASKGIIFNIQHYSIHDGPGIRTTVFMKGCPLRCFWCQNPESMALLPEIFFNSEKCTGIVADDSQHTLHPWR